MTYVHGEKFRFIDQVKNLLLCVWFSSRNNFDIFRRGYPSAKERKFNTNGTDDNFSIEESFKIFKKKIVKELLETVLKKFLFLGS